MFSKILKKFVGQKHVCLFGLFLEKAALQATPPSLPWGKNELSSLTRKEQTSAGSLAQSHHSLRSWGQEIGVPSWGENHQQVILPWHQLAFQNVSEQREDHSVGTERLFKHPPENSIWGVKGLQQQASMCRGLWRTWMESHQCGEQKVWLLCENYGWEHPMTGKYVRTWEQKVTRWSIKCLLSYASSRDPKPTLIEQLCAWGGSYLRNGAKPTVPPCSRPTVTQCCISPEKENGP